MTLAGEFGVDDVDRLCMALVPLTSLSVKEPVRIDLSGLTNMCASCLAVLISALRTARSRGLCDPLAMFTPSADSASHRWLASDTLRELLEHPADGTAPINNGRCGCQPFSSVDGIIHAREALLTAIAEQKTLDERSRATVKQLLWDLGQNVLVHADIGGGVAAARVNVHERTLELAVADCGIGIRESFVRAELPDIRDDVSAVRAALSPGVTSAPGDGKGMGLYLAKLVLADNEGRLMLRSGNAQVDEPSGVWAPDLLANFKGTLVTVLARLDRPFDEERVGEMLERPEGVTS